MNNRNENKRARLGLIDEHKVFVFISSFASGADGAIHIYRLDLNSGKLNLISRNLDVERPFYMVLSPNKQFLYSTHESSKVIGEKSSEIAAYRISANKGKLELMNRKSTSGAVACYLELAKSGKAILVANYQMGSVASLGIQNDGSLLGMSSFFQLIGTSANLDHKSKSHAHCIILSPDNRFAFAADLGFDRIQCYRFDSDSMTLLPNDYLSVESRTGLGPRHLTFHPGGRNMYSINEFGNSITVYSYEPESGRLLELQTISTLPDAFDGKSHAADLKISPDGRFLFGSNRGHDSIAVYSIAKDGRLTLKAIESSCGESPQNLAITPSGEFILCANITSGNVVVFKIGSETGLLTLIGKPIEVSSPSNMLIC